MLTCSYCHKNNLEGDRFFLSSQMIPNWSICDECFKKVCDKTLL